MKNADKRPEKRSGKRSGRLNLFDIVTIIVVLALAAGAVLKFGVLNQTEGASGQTLTYHVKIAGIRDWSTENLRVGDVLYDDNSDTAVGTITGVGVEPATMVSTKLDGVYVTGTVEGRYDVTLTVEMPGTQSNGRYYVNDIVEISANSYHSYYTKYVTFYGTCFDIGIG